MQVILIYIGVFLMAHGYAGIQSELQRLKEPQECHVSAIRINPQPLAVDFVGPPVPELRTYVDNTACYGHGEAE